MSYCNEKPRILSDKHDNFELSDEVLRKYEQEYQALGTLFTGLNWLYRNVSRIEGEVKRRLGPCVAYCYPLDNEPLLKDMPILIVECFFHWYAVSVCNFVRLIGWIGYNEHKSLKKPNEYVKSVLPEVLLWRNKIAAHFAQTFSVDDQRDNQAERGFSVAPQIGYDEGTFKVASIIISKETNDGNTCSSDALKTWSLTKVHESLLSRYILPISH
jgi:hypothetical protein